MPGVPVIWKFIAASGPLLGATAMLLCVLLFTELGEEGQTRRHQSCIVSEGQHKAEVEALADTYEYIAQLAPEEREQTLNRFIIRTLPEREARARIDRAPPYCDEQGKDGSEVGLPEPDPEIPKRPKKVRLLLR